MSQGMIFHRRAGGIAVAVCSFSMHALLALALGGRAPASPNRTAHPLLPQRERRFAIRFAKAQAKSLGLPPRWSIAWRIRQGRPTRWPGGIRDGVWFAAHEAASLGRDVRGRRSRPPDSAAISALESLRRRGAALPTPRAARTTKCWRGSPPAPRRLRRCWLARQHARQIAFAGDEESERGCTATRVRKQSIEKLIAGWKGRTSCVRMLKQPLSTRLGDDRSATCGARTPTTPAFFATALRAPSSPP